jgi:seryl-tRNA synthetase
MVNLERIRNDSEAAARLVARLADPTILHRLDELEAEHRGRARRVDELRSRRRAIANEVAHAAAGAAKIARELGRNVSDELVAAEAELSTAAAELRELWLTLPNVPHASVPVGPDSAANRVERTWGEPRLPITHPLPHWDIAKLLGLDLEGGSRLSGSRFYFLTDDLARLEIALIQFMLDMHVRLHGYRPVIPPYLVSERAM